MKKRSLPSHASILGIQFYQVFLRPIIHVWLLLNFGYANKCKHHPTCSEYTILQIKRHGTITGLKKGLVRIWNCR